MTTLTHEEIIKQADESIARLEALIKAADETLAEYDDSLTSYLKAKDLLDGCYKHC